MTTILTSILARVLEKFSGALRVIASEHARIHDGQGYTHSSLHLGLGNGGIFNHLLKVPAATYPHVRIMKITCEGAPFWIELFEGTTVSADGTAATCSNNNRNSANVAALTMFHTPTITADGTSLGSTMVTGSGGAGGSSEFFEIEWILKPSTNYLLRVTNKSGASRDWALDIFHYE